MLIDSIEVIHLRFEYPEARRFLCAGGQCTARVTSLILVRTDDGHTGVGSAYSHPGMIELVVREQLAPLLKGADPCEVETLWNKMYGITRWYGRKGAAMSALGGVDTALWDLRGQELGQPVWKLLGGDTASCPAYASALLWNDYSGLAAEATGHLDRGFRRMKMRLGRSEEYDVEAVRTVRRAIGPDNDLMCDASMRYNVPLAQRIGKVLAENQVFWFEEPFLPEDLDSFAALRGTVDVRIAAGENEFGEQGFRELIRAKAVDIVQPDASRCGGITETVQSAKLAQAAGLNFAPHSWSDAVAVMANAQVVAALGGLTVEVDQTGTPFINDLLVEPLQIRDGRLQLSDRPGLGIELNPATLEKYRLEDPYHLPEGFYSDMVFGPDHLRPAPAYRERL